MTVAQNQLQIEWSTADSVSVSSGSSQTSDAKDFSDTAFDALVTLKADNGGTPASGDTVDFYALLSCGDPDADPDSADEFPNDENDALFLARLDTNANDPAIATVPIPIAEAVKIYAYNNAGSNSITVSACILEKTG
ncbi:MAG: hypothetical protein ACXAB9_14385 [Candidatus Thorarchaeota archaeon]|jgi:hypothetical protein